jgi:hypothetical protein
MLRAACVLLVAVRSARSGSRDPGAKGRGELSSQPGADRCEEARTRCRDRGGLPAGSAIFSQSPKNRRLFLRRIECARLHDSTAAMRLSLRTWQRTGKCTQPPPPTE